MRGHRTDANQTAIVETLRQCGATVQPLHQVGSGCPDLLVGFGGKNLLLEVKNGANRPSKRKLTPDQIQWHERWRGRVAVVESPQAAIAVLEILSHE